MELNPRAAVERAMKVQEVILRALAKRISWLQAAEILGISDRRLRQRQHNQRITSVTTWLPGLSPKMKKPLVFAGEQGNRLPVFLSDVIFSIRGSQVCMSRSSAVNRAFSSLKGHSRCKALVENDSHSLIEMLFTDRDDLLFLLLGLDHEEAKRSRCASCTISKRLNWQINTCCLLWTQATLKHITRPTAKHNTLSFHPRKNRLALP